MKRNNYIICKYSEKHGWSLHCVCWKSFEFAKEGIKEARAKDKEGSYCIKIVPEEDCWWNDPTNL